MIKKVLLSTVFSLTVISAAVAEDKVIATVNGEKVYQSELTRNLKQIPNFDALPTEQQTLIKSKVVDAITKLRAVVQEAKKLDVQNTAEFKETLSDFRQQLMYSTLLENHVESAVTEAKLKAYYNEHKKDYMQTKAKAAHILLATEKEANEVIQKLKAGAKFSDLAQEFSIGPSAQNGGDLGWFDKNTMVPEFSDATFKMKKGEYTKKPVKTQFGWHVIMLEDKVENTPSLYDDVKDKIKETIMQNEVESYLDKIIKKSEIVINDEAK